jgi:hypothetical protein
MNKEIISTANAPKAIGPYEQAIKVGEFVYASGQIPLDPKTGNLVEGGITIQTRRVMENLKGVVEAAGSSLDRVVKATRDRQRRFGAGKGIEVEKIDGSADEKKKHDEDTHQGGAATLIVRLTLSEVQSRRCVQRQPLR